MAIARPGPQFAIRDVPFSYRGSWFNFSPVVAEQIWCEDIHLISHQTGMHPVLKLVPQLGGVRVAATVTATPQSLAWSFGDGRIELAYQDCETVRVRGSGLGLRIVAVASTLTSFTGTYFLRDPVDGSYLFTSYETGRRYRVTQLVGRAVQSRGEQQLGSADRAVVLGEGEWELAIEEFESGRSPYRATSAFDQVTERAAAAFAEYLEAIAPWRTGKTPAAELAAYVVWSATVDPAGFVTRPAVLMSKHWMDKIWSWDHCFNALAMAPGLADMAWHQFQLPFDHQSAAGALPDSVTHSEILYNFVKPPIHGWALRRLRGQIQSLTRDDLMETYQRLAAWTRFWLDLRRIPGRTLPHYQHGNDSGWDNATIFDSGGVVESPDLASFLVLQLRELADLADALGSGGKASLWNREANRIRSALLETWTGERFRAGTPGADRAGAGRRASRGSLLELMPIVLGDELPGPIREQLASEIREHLTPYGLATELPTSLDYLPDGYWRGPIWAPSTVLIEDGLRRSGFAELADEISGRFRALCERSGFAENFDATTGAGQRDRAYTWTASSYLILSADYERRRTRGTTSK